MTYFIHSSDLVFEGKSDMEENRKNHNFWEIVESDLKYKIPVHIKNCSK